MNPYVTYLLALKDEQQMDTPELVRRSGLTRANVHRILADTRDVLTRPPSGKTVAAFAKAFHVPEARIWVKVAQSMGLPVGEVQIANAGQLTDDELVREITRRLRRARLTAVPDMHDAEDYELEHVSSLRDASA